MAFVGDAPTFRHVEGLLWSPFSLTGLDIATEELSGWLAQRDFVF